VGIKRNTPKGNSVPSRPSTTSSNSISNTRTTSYSNYCYGGVCAKAPSRKNSKNTKSSRNLNFRFICNFNFKNTISLL
jgi:hypothetical protein